MRGWPPQSLRSSRDLYSHRTTQPRRLLALVAFAAVLIAGCGRLRTFDSTAPRRAIVVEAAAVGYGPVRAAVPAVGARFLRRSPSEPYGGDIPAASAATATPLRAADAAVYVLTLRFAAAIVASRTVSVGVASVPSARTADPPAGVTPPPSISAVMACIRGAESGNYAEASHVGGASGAYQYLGSTFRAWFARWREATGYSGPSYDLAYQAPPAIQDAVTEFTLTHGGAGNWSRKWGADGCTAGLPGGG